MWMDENGLMLPIVGYQAKILDYDQNFRVIDSEFENVFMRIKTLYYVE